MWNFGSQVGDGTVTQISSSKSNIKLLDNSTSCFPIFSIITSIDSLLLVFIKIEFLDIIGLNINLLQMF